MLYTCNVCRRQVPSVCTNGRCPKCHGTACTPGGDTSPGHAPIRQLRETLPSERKLQDGIGSHLCNALQMVQLAQEELSSKFGAALLSRKLLDGISDRIGKALDQLRALEATLLTSHLRAHRDVREWLR